jgi:sulfur carrier protein ThiS
MIPVEVTLHGTLRRFLPEGRKTQRLDVPEGETVAGLVARLGAEGQVWIAEVNGEVVRFARPLAAGDRVSLHGMIEGG